MAFEEFSDGLQSVSRGFKGVARNSVTVEKFPGYQSVTAASRSTPRGLRVFSMWF